MSNEPTSPDGDEPGRSGTSGLVALVRHEPHPADPPSPLVVTVPHAGSVYPADMGSILPHDALVLAEEPLTDVLAMAATEQGGRVLVARIGRAYLDVDRALTDVDPRLVEPAPDGGSGDAARFGTGLVRRLIAPGLPVYDRRLPMDEVQARIDRVWHPWHRAVDQAMAEAAKRSARVVLIDLHALGTQAVGLSDEPKGRRRPEIVVADLGHSSAWPALVSVIERHFRDCGYEVGRNDPWDAGETVRRQGRPAEGRHAVGIAIRRDLYLAPASRHPGAGFARLRSEIADLFARLPEVMRAQLL